MLVGLPGHAPRDTSPVGRLGAGIEAAAMTGPGIFSSLLGSGSQRAPTLSSGQLPWAMSCATGR
jgi:hypothetical protein